MTIKLNREHNLTVNHKRIYRLMKILHLQSVCRRKRKRYVQSTPEITAQNILNREFTADHFGEKWLTDVLLSNNELQYSVIKLFILSIIILLLCYNYYNVRHTRSKDTTLLI